jgi:hypothetical protein
VSRKTIAFTMLATGPRSRDRAPVDPDARAHESAPFAASDDPSAGDSVIGAESDEWVQDRDLRRAVDPPAVVGPRPPRQAADGASATIDLAAERNLIEVVSLSLLVPFALGWFWFVNAMAQRHRTWGA